MDAQADLSLRWAHTHFIGFIMRRFIFPLGTDEGLRSLIVALPGDLFIVFLADSDQNCLNNC